MLMRALFCEELGAVVQIRRSESSQVMAVLRAAGLGACSAVHRRPQPLGPDPHHPQRQGGAQREARRSAARLVGDQFPHAAAARPPGMCAAGIRPHSRRRRPGPVGDAELRSRRRRRRAVHHTGARPRMAILREQGVNGHVEMAAAFDRAGFAAIDVHMSDILAGRVALADFKGAVACGGFSYGDVLGAGQGWAKTILFNERARDELLGLLRTPGHLCPRRLQRLPDDERAQGHHPRRRRLAAFRTQPRRAVRSALFDGRGARVAVDLLRRHGRQSPAGGRFARRGAAVFASPAQQASALVAMRYVDHTASRPRSIPTTRTVRRPAPPASRPPTAVSRS
jgi:phosphoribosylformylglycinamidine synthase